MSYHGTLVAEENKRRAAARATLAALKEIVAFTGWRYIPIDSVNCSDAIFACREMHDLATRALAKAEAAGLL